MTRLRRARLRAFVRRPRIRSRAAHRRAVVPADEPLLRDFRQNEQNETEFENHFVNPVHSVKRQKSPGLRCFLFRLRFFVERALGLFDNRFERVGVVDRDVGENFTVESDAGGFQSFGEAAVG